jgi:hypothetical protein
LFENHNNSSIMPSAETDPLLSNNSSKNGDSSSYYFLSASGTGTTDAVRDLDGGEVIESAPKFSEPDEFEPRKLGVHKVRIMCVCVCELL